MKRLVILLSVCICSGCRIIDGAKAKSECERSANRVILYGAVPQLWGNGFAAIEDKLEYFKELGVNTLWLWPPINRRAQGEEYGITDYLPLIHRGETQARCKRS